MQQKSEEKRRHRRFGMDRKSRARLPDGDHHPFRLINISCGGAFLRFVEGESDRWQVAAAGILAGEVVELEFSMMVGRKLLPEHLLCRVLELSAEGVRLQFLTKPSAGLGALQALCDQQRSPRPAVDTVNTRPDVPETAGLAMYLID